LIAAYVNHVVDCIRMSISRVFSCEVSVHTCKSPTTFLRQSREFSRGKYIGAYMASTSHTNNQYTYVLIHLAAAAALSQWQICRQKFPLKFRSDSRGARFKSIRYLSSNFSLIALSQLTTSDEYRIDFTM